MKNKSWKVLNFICSLTIMGFLLLATGCKESDSGNNSDPTVNPPVATQPSGSGTLADPYIIANLDNLFWVTQNSAHWGKHFRQVANIDAAAITNFSPIGNNPNFFLGSYDGGGYTIDHIKISLPSTDYVGMFGFANSGSAIKNIKLTNVNISGNLHVGGLVGEIYYGSVLNCSSTGTVSGTGDVGGLVGVNYHSSVTTGTSMASVTGQSYVGGLVGSNYFATVSNSYSTGSVTGTVERIGGLVGFNSSSSTVSGSYSTGNATGGSRVGGLVGYNLATSVVINSYSTGNATGTSYVGGLVGWDDNSTISKSYCVGSVSGTSFVGGLAGYNDNQVIASFWNTDVYSSPAVGGGTSMGITGKTTAELKQQATFTTWDFTATWKISEGVSYPKLQWQP
ncbi:MAG: hypothetical protein HGB19_00670 [Chlorobiales bacterium]|nr:hypothetical protein [Chlorobiales bacterium]